MKESGLLPRQQKSFNHQMEEIAGKPHLKKG